MLKMPFLRDRLSELFYQKSTKMHIKKVLILSDFSDVSTSTIQYGISLANHLGADIWIQYVYQVSADISGDLYISPLVLESFEQDVRDRYTKLQEELPALRQENLHFVLGKGDLITEVNELVNSEQIDLILMGNRSKGFLTNILGSTANKVIQHASCPVLTLPAELEYQPFKKIAIALDLKETSKEVISFLKNFAAGFQARIDIIHISQAPIPVDVSKMVYSLDKAFETMGHQFFHIHAREVEEAIEHHVEGNAIDLLILLPREHPFFDSLFQKSISRQAAYQKKIPLLTIRQ